MIPHIQSDSQTAYTIPNSKNVLAGNMWFLPALKVAVKGLIQTYPLVFNKNTSCFPAKIYIYAPRGSIPRLNEALNKRCAIQPLKVVQGPRSSRAT